MISYLNNGIKKLIVNCFLAFSIIKINSELYLTGIALNRQIKIFVVSKTNKSKAEHFLLQLFDRILNR